MPISKTDPTGQAKNRRSAFRALKRKLQNAQRRVLREFRAIPRTRRTVTDLVNNADRRSVYDYDMNTELTGVIQFIVSDELLSTQSGQMPFDWYYKPEIERPYRQGTIREVHQLNQILNKSTIREVIIIDQLQVEAVLLSADYNRQLAVTYASSWDDIKGLSDTTARQVMKVITLGVEAGDTPTKIANDIKKRFSVAQSSAKRTAFTEVNKAYNDAKMRTGTIAAEMVGLKSGVMHRSALLTTTRVHHARRHGNVYTTPQQLQWWNSNHNRINCHCSIDTILMNAQGVII